MHVLHRASARALVHSTLAAWKTAGQGEAPAHPADVLPVTLGMAHDPASLILSFYDGGPDHRGRTLEEILAQSDAWLEASHDYIQWVFPLPERSPYNPSAPVLKASDIAAFGVRPGLRRRLLDGFRRMLDFYGFTLESDQEDRWRVTPGGRQRTMRWITPHNHNFLRISRILRCLHLLGCAQAGSAFLAALEPLARGEGREAIGAVTLAYWRSAARGELPG